MFWLLQIVLLWIWGCRYLFKLTLSLPLDIFPEMELLDHMIALYLIFWGSSILFYLVAVPIYKFTNSTRVPFSLHPHQHLLSCLSDDGHSNRHEVISHCGFNMHFSSKWLVTFTIFSCACWPFICHLWGSVCQVLCPIFNCVISGWFFFSFFRYWVI